MADLSGVARAFEQFAADCRDSSPLYERLSLEIARDEDMLAFAAHTPQRQPVPNLLFAAVRFLLFKARGADLNGRRDCELESIGAFRKYCFANKSEIVGLLSTRRVQTNEVRRCAYLLPAFARAVAGRDSCPLAMIELGTSAGLLLNWDRYGYQYGENTIAGSSDSAVQLVCECRTDPSAIPLVFPEVASKVGVDVNVLDMDVSDDRLWLASLIWPEHSDRARLLAAAIEVQRRYPVRLLNDEALALLPQLLSEVVDGSVPCVFHTAVLNQFSREDRERLAGMLDAHGANRDLVWISAELGGRPLTVDVVLTSWVSGTRSQELVAHAHPHGRWLEWLRNTN
jgi:hypothetical protein